MAGGGEEHEAEKADAPMAMPGASDPVSCSLSSQDMAFLLYKKLKEQTEAGDVHSKPLFDQMAAMLNDEKSRYDKQVQEQVQAQAAAEKAEEEVKIANTKLADAADKAKKDEGKKESKAANKTAYDKLRKEADTAMGKASDAKIAYAKATESTSKFRT